MTVLTGGWIWDALDQRLNCGRDLRIYYDRDCGFCLASCHLLRSFLILPHARIEAAQDTPRAKALMEAHWSWVVIDRDNTAHLKFEAFIALLKASPLLRWVSPLLSLRPMVAIGTRVYDSVANSRGEVAGTTAWLWQSRDVRFIPGRALQAMAGATRHLGLAATRSTSYYQPFEIARSFATLDHLSGGRAAWNIVTSFQEAEARNFSRDEQIPRHRRYDRADEFLEVVTRLWDSWEDEALVLDRAAPLFADPAKVHRIDHEGEWFKVRGPLNVPRPPLPSARAGSRRGTVEIMPPLVRSPAAGGTPTVIADPESDAALRYRDIARRAAARLAYAPVAAFPDIEVSED